MSVPSNKTLNTTDMDSETTGLNGNAEMDFRDKMSTEESADTSEGVARQMKAATDQLTK